MFGISCRIVWCGCCGRKGIVVCLKKMKDLFGYLGFIGCCLILCQHYYLVGEIGLGSTPQMFGTSCRLVWCGWCERKGIVVCLKKMKDLFGYLGFIGCCLILCQHYYLVGEIGLGSTHQMFGTSCRLVWCGWCGRKGMVLCLKMLRDPLINCNHCSSIPCLIGFGQGFLNFVVLFLTSITH